MEEEFRALLKASAPVTAQVGTRINYGEHPQGEPFPALVLTTVSGIEELHLNGKGPFEATVQVDCYAETYSAAKLASRAVVSALNAYRGGGFLFITHVSTRDTREGGTNEADRPYRTSLDFNTTWSSE